MFINTWLSNLYFMFVICLLSQRTFLISILCFPLAGIVLPLCHDIHNVSSHSCLYVSWKERASFRAFVSGLLEEAQQSFQPSFLCPADCPIFQHILFSFPFIILSQSSYFLQCPRMSFPELTNPWQVFKIRLSAVLILLIFQSENDIERM